MSAEKSIEALGWSLIYDRENWPYVYCAKQREFFSGQWRKTPDEVLKDLLEARKASGKAPSCPVGESDAPNHVRTPQNA